MDDWDRVEHQGPATVSAKSIFWSRPSGQRMDTEPSWDGAR